MDHEVPGGQAEEVARLLRVIVQRLFFVEDRLSTRLPVGQLRVCGLLYQSARPMSSLSQELGVSQSALTQIADRLERAGLVRRLAEPSDRRVKQLQLTARGEKIMRLREGSRVSKIAAALAHLPPEAQCRLRAALAELAQAAKPDGRRPGASLSQPL